MPGTTNIEKQDATVVGTENLELQEAARNGKETTYQEIGEEFKVTLGL
ncbi:MAG: hypothetical protein GY866_41065 [Proteobacteria bacterium]|nr:hypothetical protein [Pseudomonadota bacterium]